MADSLGTILNPLNSLTNNLILPVQRINASGEYKTQSLKRVTVYSKNLLKFDFAAIYYLNTDYGNMQTSFDQPTIITSIPSTQKIFNHGDWLYGYITFTLEKFSIDLHVTITTTASVVIRNCVIITFKFDV